MPMMQEQYKQEVIPKMKKRFGYSGVLEVPKIRNVVVHTGIGKLVAQKASKEQEQIAQQISRDLAIICGQKPLVTRAKKSIASFKLREGTPSGLKVTLRKKRMYEFLERFIYIALPRSRDFRGIGRNSVDQGGNLTIGLAEHTVFPEILPEEAVQNLGLEVTIVTDAKDREEALVLFELLGFPLQKEQKV